MTRISLLLLAAVLSASNLGCATTETRQADDGVFIHIQSGPDNPHAVLMGMQMASMMAEDRDTLIYFDVDGIDVITNDAPNLSMEPFGSSHETLAKLIDSGVSVYACPGCLKAAGKTPDDLMSGVRVAEKDAFFDFTDGRILTLDY
ncbi:MAG: DsrE family protein [Phycisphaeraceae bacterium]